jgi:hypothetical protein
MDARTRLTENVGQFLSEIQELSEAVAKGPGRRPSLHDVEFRVRAALQALGHAATAWVVESYGTGHVGNRHPCGCGASARFKAVHGRNLLDLQGGTVRVDRAYYYCESCGQGFLPLDEELGLGPEEVTPLLSDVMQALGVVVPFRQAACLLERTSGVVVSEERVRRVTERAGQRCLVEDEAQAARAMRAPEDSSPPATPAQSAPADRQYVLLDGGMVPTRDGFREAKVGVCFRADDRVDVSPERGALVRKHFFGDIVTAEVFGPRVYAAARSHGVAEDGTGCEMLGDGAAWIWNLKAEHLPGATETVDWYHAKEHLWATANAVHGEGTPEAARWAERREDELWNDRPASVLAALGRMRPKTDAARQAVADLKHYVTENRQRMHYASRREQGLLVGSGAVEGGIKHLVQDRLKRAGMRWSLDGARHVLALRTRWTSETWDEPGARPAATRCPRARAAA